MRCHLVMTMSLCSHLGCLGFNPGKVDSSSFLSKSWKSVKVSLMQKPTATMAQTSWHSITVTDINHKLKDSEITVVDEQLLLCSWWNNKEKQSYFLVTALYYNQSLPTWEKRKCCYWAKMMWTSLSMERDRGKISHLHAMFHFYFLIEVSRSSQGSSTCAEWKLIGGLELHAPCLDF